MVEVNLQIFIARDGSTLLTPERVQLLRLIQAGGSLHMAAKESKISYNKAWKMIDAMNTATQKTIVEKTRGGSGGGGTALTSFGELILSEYNSIEKEVKIFNDKINNEIRM